MSNGKQSEDSKQIKEKEKNAASLDEKANDDSNHVSSTEGSDKGSDHEDEETKEMEEESAKEEEEDESSDKQNKTEKKGKSKTAAKDKTAKVDSEFPTTVEDPSLPDGWFKRVVQRRTGKTAGRIDVYIFNPKGKKFRSKNELKNHFRRTKSNLNAEDFDFKRPGKENNRASKPAPRQTKRTGKRKVSFPSTPSAKRKKGNKSEDNKTKSDTEKKKLLVKLPLVSPKKMLSDYAQQNKSKSGKKSKPQERNQVKNSRSLPKGKRGLPKRARQNKKSIKVKK